MPLNHAWIEMCACLPVTLLSTYLSFHPLPWTHCPWWLSQRRRRQVMQTGPLRPKWQADETNSSWQLTGLLSLQWDFWLLPLSSNWPAAPAERPLTKGVYGQHGAWDLSLVLETHLAVVMVFYRKSWVFSPPCLSVCAVRFVYHWIRLISTNVYSGYRM